jgi:hypothetical protein
LVKAQKDAFITQPKIPSACDERFAAQVFWLERQHFVSPSRDQAIFRLFTVTKVYKSSLFETKLFSYSGGSAWDLHPSSLSRKKRLCHRSWRYAANIFLHIVRSRTHFVNSVSFLTVTKQSANFGLTAEVIYV